MSEILSQCQRLVDRLRTLDATVGTPTQVETQLSLVVAMLEQAEQAMARAQREFTAEAVTQVATPAVSGGDHAVGTVFSVDDHAAEALTPADWPSGDAQAEVPAVAEPGDNAYASTARDAELSARELVSSEAAVGDALVEHGATLEAAGSMAAAESADMHALAPAADAPAAVAAASSSLTLPRWIPPASQEFRDGGIGPAVVRAAGQGPDFTPLIPSQSAGGNEIAAAIRARQSISNHLTTGGVDDVDAHPSAVPLSTAVVPPAVAPTVPPATPASPSAAVPARPPATTTAHQTRATTATSAHVTAPQLRSQEIRLPNANAGRPYDADLGAHLPAGTRVRMVGPFPEGLQVDRIRLVGKPAMAGEYRIGWEQEDGRVVGALLLTVNADPRALWQDKPSDLTDRYWKPDWACESGESPVARAVVASVRGRSHAHVGSFRDDDFALHMPTADEGPNGWHVLVVADGAGGAKHSRCGSKIACEVITKHLVETLRAPETRDVAELVERSLHATEQDKADNAFWSPRLYKTLVPGVAKAQAAVRNEADSIGASKKDFHTTLLVAIVRRTTAGAWFVGTYWIGDGAIGMWDDSWSAPKVFGEADSGEFAGETTFLTHEDFNKTDVVNRRLRYSIVPSFSYLALMTDGISDPKFDAETKLKSPEVWRAFTADLLTAAEGAPLADITGAQMMEWMQFWSQGNHDDRTLLLFHPRAPAGGHS